MNRRQRADSSDPDPNPTPTKQRRTNKGFEPAKCPSSASASTIKDNPPIPTSGIGPSLSSSLDKPLEDQFNEYLLNFPCETRTNIAITKVYKNECGPVKTINFFSKFRIYDVTTKDRILNLSLHPGGNRIANLAMLSPEAVRQVTWFNRPYLQRVAQGDDRPSIFYMVGCITHCQIRSAPVSKKMKTNYQVCIVPFDWAWDRIYSNIAAVTLTAQLVIPTYMGGVSFITMYSDSNAEAKVPSFNGPVRHAAPFHAKNGSSRFSFKGIRALNDIEGELPVGVPVLVTFTPINAH
ncbi:hypothetical protein M422DRAFT_272287 [Sphaerobolus stellatus SS14]|uniref:Uncharacterized protein n=1 Tax=Sphaerobolus stellatus (strain SS14) TaxID=990650 RepID=A0A0C9TXQ5_SPHS4|nr:hypothetical protein M422DRAFT_272287 [Sphaerobolus stellatus SS14]